MNNNTAQVIELGSPEIQKARHIAQKKYETMKKQGFPVSDKSDFISRETRQILRDSKSDR